MSQITFDCNLPKNRNRDILQFPADRICIKKTYLELEFPNQFKVRCRFKEVELTYVVASTSETQGAHI